MSEIIETITEAAYEAAKASKDAAEKIIAAYFDQRRKKADDRWVRFGKGEQWFTPDELHYAANTRCSCGAGLAYPKNCGSQQSWYCSAVLTGNFDKEQQHDTYPFAFYDIKSELQPSANGATTRPS